MQTHLDSYTIYLSFSTVVTVIAALIAWQRKAPGSFTLSLLMLAMSIWSGGYALHWVPLPESVQLMLPSLTYLGVLAVPTLFLIYALQFSNHENWLTPRICILLAIEPLITAGLLATNRFNHLMFLSIQSITESGFNPIEIAPGPWYYVNLFYSFFLIALGFVALILGMSHTSPLLRRQYRMVLLASAIPWTANIFTELFSLTSKVDLTPFMFGLAGVLFSYAVLRNRFMDLIPVARSRLIESMSDAILVVDLSNRIVDINPAMQEILQVEQSSFLGRPASDVLRSWMKNVDQLINGSETRTELRTRSNPTRYLDLRVTPLYDHYRRLNGRLLVFRDVTERKQVERKLRYANERLQSQLIEIGTLQSKLRSQAIRDPLTDLFNRRYLDETLDRELARSSREAYPVCVIMMDIDYFKHVNDTYGHEAGDRILRSLAQVLSRQNRRGDFACRYGGEEFVVVMPNITLRTARQRAEQLRISLSAVKVQYGRFQLSTTLSIGIACYPSDGDDRESILRAADRALYAAKNAGRNQVVTLDQLPVASAGIDPSAEENQILTSF